MQRKVIQQGSGGFTIYLPKKWIDNNKIIRGDLVSIREDNNTLTVSLNQKEKTKKQCSLPILNKDKSRLRTIISSAYRRGFDKVILESEENFSFVQINKIINSLQGYVVTEESKNKVIIENIMNEKFENVDKIIHRFLMTINYFINEVLEKKITSSELEELHLSILKSRDYCQRMIQVNNYEGDKSYEYHNIIMILEKFSSGFYELMKYDIKPSLEIKEMCTIFKELTNTLTKKEIKEAQKLNKDCAKLKDKILSSKKAIAIEGKIVTYLFTFSSRIVSVLV